MRRNAHHGKRGQLFIDSLKKKIKRGNPKTRELVRRAFFKFAPRERQLGSGKRGLFGLLKTENSETAGNAPRKSEKSAPGGSKGLHSSATIKRK